jgi:hypothetical protein
LAFPNKRYQVKLEASGISQITQKWLWPASEGLTNFTIPLACFCFDGIIKKLFTILISYNNSFQYNILIIQVNHYYLRLLVNHNRSDSDQQAA